MVFPHISWQIHNKLASHPVSEKELDLKGSQIYYGNYTPCLVTISAAKNSDYAGMIFMVHNMYQCLLSFKTQTQNQKNSKSKAVDDYFSKAVKFSTLAQEGTLHRMKTVQLLSRTELSMSKSS